MTDLIEEIPPFVACVSHGGPFDDEAFDAGYTTGLIDAGLRSLKHHGGDNLACDARTVLLPQLELIAAGHGFRHVKMYEHELDGYSLVTFHREEHVCGR